MSHTTASQSVNGTAIASQTAARLPGEKSVRSSPSHNPPRIAAWITARVTMVGIPVGARSGNAKLMPTNSTASTVPTSRRPNGAVCGSTGFRPTVAMVMGQSPLATNRIVTIYHYLYSSQYHWIVDCARTDEGAVRARSASADGPGETMATDYNQYCKVCWTLDIL